MCMMFNGVFTFVQRELEGIWFPLRFPCSHLFQLLFLRKVKSMQRSGTETIRTQIQPSKPKREITNITNSQNIKRKYGQPSEQLFPKRWPLSNRNRTKTNINTHKVKCHRNSVNKSRQQRTTTRQPPWNGQ